jgi:hypothetical protein
MEEEWTSLPGLKITVETIICEKQLKGNCRKPTLSGVTGRINSERPKCRDSKLKLKLTKDKFQSIATVYRLV